MFGVVSNVGNSVKKRNGTELVHFLIRMEHESGVQQNRPRAHKPNLLGNEKAFLHDHDRHDPFDALTHADVIEWYETD